MKGLRASNLRELLGSMGLRPQCSRLRCNVAVSNRLLAVALQYPLTDRF